jgi:antitoxin (DNA-binding transcriptional repressor) of toxin-antitoxin stability system
MATITIEEAQATLSELIHRLAPGDEVTITENERTVAKLTVAPPPPVKKPRVLGSMKGTVLYMAPDFDAPLDDFKDYM